MRDLFRRFYRWWREFGKFLNEITLALTFLSFIPVVMFILYHLLWDFDLCRVIAGAIVFRVLVRSNIEL